MATMLWIQRLWGRSIPRGHHSLRSQHHQPWAAVWPLGFNLLYCMEATASTAQSPSCMCPLGGVSHSKSRAGTPGFRAIWSAICGSVVLGARVTEPTLSGYVEKACCASSLDDSFKHRRTSGVKLSKGTRKSPLHLQSVSCWKHKSMTNLESLAPLTIA